VSVKALGFLSLATSARQEWIEFAGNTLGMQVGAETTPGVTRVRLDDRSFRLEITDAEEEAVFRIGWEVSDAAALERVVERLEADGLTVERCGADEAAASEVLGLVRATDRSGFRLEFFYGQRKSVEPFISPRSAKFVTGDLGLGHAVLLTPVFDEMIRFYTEVLGFRVSDTMKMGPSRVTFLRCNARHHSVAFVEAPVTGLHHFMVEATEVDMVGRAFDGCRDRGTGIMMDLGRHSNDEMFSFYAVTPSGFGLEYGHGGVLVDDAAWTVTEISGPSLWGHRMATA
jgi:2,3-dihydroxybiphenyl 1,2-dioxygenase